MFLASEISFSLQSSCGQRRPKTVMIFPMLGPFDEHALCYIHAWPKPRKRAHFGCSMFRNWAPKTFQRAHCDRKTGPKRSPFRVLEGRKASKLPSHPVFHHFPRPLDSPFPIGSTGTLGHHLQLFIVGENGLSQQRRRGRKGRSGRTSNSLS